MTWRPLPSFLSCLLFRKGLRKGKHQSREKQHAQGQQPLVAHLALAAAMELNVFEKAEIGEENGFVAPQVKEVNQQRDKEREAGEEEEGIEERHVGQR